MTDQDWKKLIDWLGKMGYVLHIPLKGSPYLTDRRGNYVGKY